MLLGLFLAFAGIAIIASILMLASRNAVHSALFLVVAMSALGGIFLLLGAELLAMLQIIVYGGAIVVLFLFVLMLLNVRQNEFSSNNSRLHTVFGIALSIMLTFQISVTFYGKRLATAGPELTEPAALGKTLYTTYLLPVELASLILLIAMIGVVVLIKQREEGEA